MIIAATLYRDASTYPNAPAHSVAERMAIYWRCLCAAFLSARRYGHHRGRLIVFTNDDPPKDLRDILLTIQVEFIDIARRFILPTGTSPPYAGSRYLLDAMEWAETHLGNETLLFVDPDVFFTANIATIAQSLTRYGALFIEIPYPHDHKGNGISRADIAEIINDLGHVNAPAIPRWIGGEVIGLAPKALRQLLPSVRQIFADSVSRQQNGAPHLHTEEHILTAAVKLAGLPYDLANDGLASRIFTARRFRNHNPHTTASIVWHLPTEKTFGFRTAYKHLLEFSKHERIAPHEIDTFRSLFGLSGPTTKEFAFIALSILDQARKFLRALARRPNDFGQS